MARSNFFTDSDSWFNRGLSRLFDILLLGVLTTVLCIPVITIGAAVTANMDIMLRIALKKENRIFKQYFSAFGKNFLKSTVIWILYLLAGLLIGGAVFVTIGGMLTMDQTIRVIMAIVSIIMLIMYGISICYVFALQARYEDKIFNTITNSLLIAVSSFPKSFVMLALTVILCVLGFFFTGLIPLFVILEFSFVTYISGKLIVSVLAKFGDREAAGEEIVAEEETEDSRDEEKARKSN